ncbi:hypothetical protein E2C01_082767 [Portunus trituberculatus]|uniref:Uncharacterized protein n=1 Tax=Portunus trituberculatus TaxID=210409 RepID=A0A5B7J2N2_PORTR|nr:hypothetical protein [Portunus trituberculatus]
MARRCTVIGLLAAYADDTDLGRRCFCCSLLLCRGSQETVTTEADRMRRKTNGKDRENTAWERRSYHEIEMVKVDNMKPSRTCKVLDVGKHE